MSQHTLPVNYKFIRHVHKVPVLSTQKIVSAFYNDRELRLTTFYKPIIHLI
jgi:hypothetical protein